MLSKTRLKCLKALGIEIPEVELIVNMDMHTKSPFMGNTESQHMDRHTKNPFMGNTKSQHMDRHTENPIMGNTKSRHYNKLVKKIARHKQLGILIPDELIDELAKVAKLLKAKTNVE